MSLFKTQLRVTIAKIGLGVLVLAGVCFMLLSPQFLKSSHAKNNPPGSSGNVFASSSTIPLLQFPEGITSWNNKIYISTYNVNAPTSSRIFVFDASNGKLKNTIGGQPGQELVSANVLLGLTIDHNTGDLYVGANGSGQILRIQNPDSKKPTISVYATYPSGGGPEDLVFFKDGTLFASDSNLGAVYSIPPGGGKINTVIAPGNPLLAAPVAGLNPNGVIFSQDWHTLYVANTYSDNIIKFGVNDAGQLTDSGSVFAQNVNHDLEEYPTGFDALVLPDTKIGASASTPLNGPDGLALDSQGRIWVASNLGDNLTVLDPTTGKVVETFGTSAVTQKGLLNQPAGMTFVGNTVYCTNLGIFTGLAGSPNLPFTVASFDAGVSGAGGNGNYGGPGGGDNNQGGNGQGGNGQ
jgi:sugar lactone lactonase YvrE